MLQFLDFLAHCGMGGKACLSFNFLESLRRQVFDIMLSFSTNTVVHTTYEVT